LSLAPGQCGPRPWRQFAVVWICTHLLLSGCQTCYPRPTQRSVDELYYEALAVQKPEFTLGGGGAFNAPLVDGSVEPLVEPLPLMLPPHEATAFPLTPPAAPLPLAPALPPGGVPPRTTSVQAVSHSHQNSSSQQIVVANSSGEKLVSDIYTQTDVREAIQALATQAGVSVILDDTAVGEVSCTIENEPFEQALQRILLPLGLVYCKKENRYLIGTTDPSSNLFPHIAETIEFRPHHLSALELIALLPPRFATFTRTVEKRNLIVIEAPHDAAQLIHAQLQSADQPIPQIMIEAVICVVAPDKGLQFGFDWNHILNVQGLDRLNVGLTGLSFSAATNAGSDIAVTSAFLKLLAKEGYVTIRAAPRVMAKDGEKAEISIARDTFFSIQQTGSQFNFNQNIQKVESGISLTITPAIRGDTVQLQIEKAEVSEDIRAIDPQQNLTNSPYPVINRRKVSTVVQVKDRHTVVIGGLVQRQTVDRETRVPYLGSLPGLGILFRRIEKQEQDAEVAIFISPQIVIPTANAPVAPVCPQPIPMLEVPAEMTIAAPLPVQALPPAPLSGAVIPELRAIPVQ
jgi:type IV pilus assembly protein PilQ